MQPTDAKVIVVVAWLGNFLLLAIPGLLVYLLTRETNDHAAKQGLEAFHVGLNAFVVSAIATILAIVIGIITLGIGLFLVIPAVALLGLAYIAAFIYGAIAGISDPDFRMPFTFRFMTHEDRDTIIDA